MRDQQYCANILLKKNILGYIYEVVIYVCRKKNLNTKKISWHLKTYKITIFKGNYIF